MEAKTDLKAIGIGMVTLVGVRGEPPHAFGNCFGMQCEDGAEYKIVNFVYENLVALIAAGLTYPVDIRVLSGRTAVMHDKRIPSNWYSQKFCEVCCPSSLLPMPQALRIEREVMQGVRENRNGLVMMNFGKPSCLIKLPEK